MLLTWDALVALIALAGAVCTAAIFLIDHLITKRLDAFLVRLNGSYLRRETALARFDDLQHQIDDLKESTQ